MTLRDVEIQILDEIDTIINSPVVDPEEVKARVKEIFRQIEEGGTEANSAETR